MALTKLKTSGIADDAVTTDKLANAINTERTANTAKVSLDADSVTGAKIADDAIDSEHITDGSIDNAHLADDAVGVAELSATGTASSSTFLRGDNSWAAVTSTTINNNADNRVITGSGTANTLEAESSLTYNGSSNLTISGSGQQQLTIGSTDAGGAVITLDGDSNGDGAGGDYSFIRHNTDGDLEFFARNTGGATNTIFKQSTTESMRIDSSGRVMIGTTTEGQGTADDFTIETSGSTGITLRSGTANDGSLFFSDGTSGLDEYRGYIQYEHANNALAFGTDAAERMRIDSSGNVGIGTTSPQEILHVKAASEAIGNRDGVIFGSTDSLAADKGLPLVWAAHIGTAADYGIASICGRKENSTSDNGAGYLQFGTGNAAGNISEIMRLTSSGTLAQTTGDTVYTASVAGAIRMQLIHTGGGDVTFSNPSSGSATYSTSSDYRLKQDVVDLPNAWSTVKALKPYEYKWKHNTSKTSQGFFAHEVIATVPNSQAGQGTKDAVDEDDKPIYQQIDYSKLVPVLTKALQEAIGKIEVLETKVAALEAK